MIEVLMEEHLFPQAAFVWDASCKGTHGDTECYSDFSEPSDSMWMLNTP